MVSARGWWFTAVILTTWEDEIRRSKVQVQPRKIVHEAPSPK
jgi:hypothetical protein